MSPEFAKNSLFQPFSQEHPGARTLYQGTGLGMSIVKELVTRMNGSIHVDSAPGVGTTFTVELPLPWPSRPSRPPPPLRQSQPGLWTASPCCSPRTTP